MVHRRTVIAAIVFLALIFLFASHDDSQATSLLGKHFSRVKDECAAPNRLGGSVISTTGDPDDLSTGGGFPDESHPPGWGNSSVRSAMDTWADACVIDWIGPSGPAGLGRTLWFHIVRCLRAGEVEFTD